MANVYCALCGVILLPDPYVEEGTTEPEPPPRRRRPWCSEVRGLTTNDDASNPPTLTGVGLMYGPDRLSATIDCKLSYLDSQLTWEWGLSTTSWGWGSWAFGVHDACWQILRLRVGGWHERRLIISVFHQLLCVPCIGSSSFDFGHDYDGASQTHKRMGPPMPINLGSVLYADPHAVPLMVISEPAMPQSLTSFDYLQGASCHTFGPLSMELIHEILSYLSRKEVAALRLVSRALASIAAVENLPQSYWRSRFLLGQEADFIFPDLTERRDWRGFFLALNKLLRHGGTLPLLNRKRIRKLIEPISRLLEDAPGPHGGLFGMAAQRVPNQESRFQISTSDDGGHIPAVLEESNSFAGDISTDFPDGPVYSGCRVFDHVTWALPNPRQYNQGTIAVSSCRIGVMTFIAGIGIFPSRTTDNYACIIGFHNPGAEKWLDMPTASSIERIHVALSAQGLMGIMFSFTDGTESSWTGVSEGRGIAQGSLNVTGESQPCHLLAGVDLFKIVSLGVYSLRNDPNSHSQAPPAIPPLHPQSHLWVPSPPTHDGLQLTPLYPTMEPLLFEPLLDVDFGGPGGVYLSELIGLVCYMGYDPHPLLGMQAVYADGRTALFGSRRGCEAYFAIAGPDGERITQVSVLNDCDDPSQTSVNGLCGLRFTTNYRRTEDFATIQSRLKNNLDIIEVPEPNHIITGLAVPQMPSKDPFIRVALQYQPSASSVPNQSSLLFPESEVCKESLQYTKYFSRFIRTPRAGDYQTYASLKGVRRIQASIGAEGRCRSPSRISGLRLFYDSGPPSILGQWMDEYKTFDLLPGEDIEYLTVWILPAADAVEWRPARQGQVVAVRFDTTKSRSMTFSAPGAASLRAEALRMQYGYGDGYKVTDILWIMNSSYDRVRATGCGKVERPSELVPDEYPDQVQRLYFDRMELDPVVTAKGWLDNGQLLGVEFIYMSGATARVGELNTASGSIETVHFPRNCRFVGMATGIKDTHIRVLKFDLENRNTPSRAEYSTVGFGLPPSDGHQILSECDWQHVWPNPEQSVQDPSQSEIREKIHTPPTGMRLAGLYFNCQDFASVGGLYEPVGREARGGTA